MAEAPALFLDKLARPGVEPETASTLQIIRDEVKSKPVRSLRTRLLQAVLLLAGKTGDEEQRGAKRKRAGGEEDEGHNAVGGEGHCIKKTFYREDS